MTYSIDLRERVIDYVRSGGSQTAAVALFKVDRKTVYNWLHRADLAATPSKTRKRKLDKAALAEHVRSYPDALLRERAATFGVKINAVWTALQKLGISKKNDSI